MIIHGLIEDLGDGSSTIRWYKNEKIALYLLKNDELYYSNGDEITQTLNLPDDINLEHCGIKLSDSYYVNIMHSLDNED